MFKCWIRCLKDGWRAYFVLKNVNRLKENGDVIEDRGEEEDDGERKLSEKVMWNKKFSVLKRKQERLVRCEKWKIIRLKNFLKYIRKMRKKLKCVWRKREKEWGSEDMGGERETKSEGAGTWREREISGTYIFFSPDFWGLRMKSIIIMTDFFESFT